MAFITWNDTYSVGVREIDEQHQKIVSIINRLFDVFEIKQTEDEEMAKVFEELMDYADNHFATEEKYFERFGYDKSAPHIDMHNQYRNKIKDLKTEFETSKSKDVFFEVMNYLQDWWVWHINHTDKEYTKCFNDNGLV